jgi:hypothetical protein
MLRVFGDRVLRKIFAPATGEVTGEWRRLHNEELYDMCSSANIFQVIQSGRMGWAGHVARIGKRRVACRVLVGKLEGKIPLGTHVHTW